jgi:hypothetical protein
MRVPITAFPDTVAVSRTEVTSWIRASGVAAQWGTDPGTTLAVLRVMVNDLMTDGELDKLHS